MVGAVAATLPGAPTDVQTRQQLPGSTFLFDLATWNQFRDDLRGIDANARSASTAQAFAWSGHVAKANAVWWKADDKGVLLQADVNGDAKADFEIRLWNTDSIAVGDLLL